MAAIGSSNPEERRKLLRQLDDIKKAIEEQQKRETAEQDGRLEEALRNRRMRKQQAVQDHSTKQHEIMIKEVQDNAKALIDTNVGADVDEAQVQTAF